jgi:glycine/D-amino acid oxidase-like deaminating enzyme
MLSFWESNSLINYQYIIVGAGITGLSTACAIKEKNPRATVLVIEKGILPTGASTKNAGFACVGSYTEKWADYERLGEEQFLQLIEDRWVGLYLLRKRLGDDHINYINHGGFELMINEGGADADKVAKLNDMLAPMFKKQVFYIAPQFIKQFGFNSEIVSDMVFNPFEGQIDTGKMMNTLVNYAGILQIRVITGTDVKHIEDTPTGAKVYCENNGQKITFNAEQVAICTNAFTKHFLPDEEVTPGRGQVLCTSPINDLRFTGIFHFDEGYYYFRNYGKRVIFGGGRNIDFETETTTTFELNERIQNQLNYFLEEVILPGTNYTIEQQWSGIMAFNQQKTPLVKRVNPHIVVGARLNGMGIALASKVADTLADLMIKP